MNKHIKRQKIMGEEIANILKDFSKNQLIAYFLIIWAATFVFSAVSGFLLIAEWHGSIFDIIFDGLWNMTEIGCAIILIMLGLKILSSEE